MLPVDRKQPISGEINTTAPTSTTSSSSTGPSTLPVPKIEIKHDQLNPVDKATNHAAHDLQHSTKKPLHVPNAMTMHAVDSTPAPKSAAEFFKKHGIDHGKQVAELERTEKQMKDYETDVRNLRIRKIAATILTPILLGALIVSAVALASIIPPIGGLVTAGMVIGLSMGLAYGTTGLACVILGGGMLIAAQEPATLEEDKRELLRKNLTNTNTAMELFEKHPKNRVNPDGSSYEEFLDTLPAITKDGVRSFELDQLNKYNDLFKTKLKLQKFNDKEKINEEVRAAENKLRALGVADPVNVTSAQSRIAELKAEFESPIEIISGTDDGVEMKNVNAIQNEKKINSIKDIFNSLVDLRELSKEADEIFFNNTEESLKAEMEAGRAAIQKVVAEKQKEIDKDKPNKENKEIETQNKELVAAKKAYLDQLRSSNIPENELETTLEQREASLQEATNKTQGLEKKIKALIESNPQLQRKPNRAESEINNNIARLDNEIEDVKRKLADNGVRDLTAPNAIQQKIAELREIKERGFSELSAMKKEIAQLNEAKLKNPQNPDELKKIEDSLKAKNAKLANMQEEFDLFEKEDLEEYRVFGTKQINALEDLSKSLDKLKIEKLLETDMFNIAQLKTAQTKLTSDITELKSIIDKKIKYKEIENKKKILELNAKTEQLNTKLEELKGKADATSDRFTQNRIGILKSEVTLVKNDINNAKIDSANVKLKKLESGVSTLAGEDNYRTQVNARYAEFKEKHSKLSPEDRASRLKEEAWKKTEEYQYHEAERERIDNLIKAEKEKLEDSQYRLLQSSLYRGFSELAKLQHFKNIAIMERTRYLKDISGV